MAANLMIRGWKNDPSIVDLLAGSGVRHVFTSAGDPALFTDALHSADMTVVHVVGSLRAAQKAIVAGVDALVIEGVEGGGFKSALGMSTMRVVNVGLAARLLTEAIEVLLLGRVSDLYFKGDFDATVANTGQVSTRVQQVLPVADIVRNTWEGALTAMQAGRAVLS